MTFVTIYLVSLVSVLPIVYSLSCYQCVSTQPGCGAELDSRWHWSWTCEDNDDKCVKIVERKGATEVITRSCLSNLEFLRHDIPADKYEGCRPAALDIKLAHYVNNTVKQLDIKRNYYDDVLWCFCEFDHFCNSTTPTALLPSILIVSIFLTCSLLIVALLTHI